MESATDGEEDATSDVSQRLDQLSHPALGFEEEVVETLQRTIPVRPGHLWCGGQDVSVDISSDSDAGDTGTLDTLKKHHAEILDRLDRLHDSLDILTRMSLRTASIPWKDLGKVSSMKAEAGSKPAPLSSSPPDPSEEVKNPARLSAKQKQGFRPSFTPNIFSSFEQFDLSLKKVAARADSAVRKRKFASIRRECSLQEKQEGFVKRVVQHPGFDFFFAFIVLSNSIFIGVEVQIGLESQGPRPLAIYIFQYAYTFLFCVELGMRLWADTRFYLCDEWMWTWLDAFIVLSSLWELVVDIIYVWTGGQASEPERLAGVINLKALRVLRITRIVKAVRLMRIFRFVMALRTLITSILHTLQSLFWALALLVLIVYVFSVLFVQAVQDHLLDPESTVLPDREMVASQRYFSSLPDTMLSLFMCIAGGVSWEDVQAPLKAISTMWVFCFLFFVCFTYFAVLNVVARSKLKSF